MNSIVTMDSALTMSSREIADLVESRHDNVKRAIERLSERQLNNDGTVKRGAVIVRPPMEDEQIKDSMGRSRTESVYVFSGKQGKRDSLIVVAQLCPEFTARLVDRWHELEELVQQPAAMQLPQTYSDALRLLADQVEEAQRISHQRDEAIRTKAQISSSREASTMGKLSAATKKIAKLEQAVGDSRDWKTAKSIAWLPEVFDLTGKKNPAYSQIGKKLTAISNEIGVEIREVEDSAYGKVKAYHLDAINELHSRINSDPGLLSKYRKNNQERAA